MSNNVRLKTLMMKTGGLRSALPLAHVVETLRPLPVQRLADVPEFVIGVTVIRGQPTPVVDIALLLGVAAAAPSARFVMVRAGAYAVVLAVEAVIGIQDISPEAFSGVPPLLANAGAEAVTAIGALDQNLLVVLQAARLVPNEVWTALAEAEKA